MNALKNKLTKALFGTMVVVGGFATAAQAAQPPVAQPRPLPNSIGQVRPLPTPNRRPPFIDTSWQNDPLTWYRIQHRGQNPPYWWWQQNYPYRPYPLPYPYPVVTPVIVPQPVPMQSPAPIVDQPRIVRNKIQLVVPNAKAEVSLDGTVIPGLGMNRWIDTPNQTEGQSYSYQITVRWDNNGQPMCETRTVNVQAGRYGFADFTRPQRT